jgi:hypothetical protein
MVGLEMVLQWQLHAIKRQAIGELCLSFSGTQGSFTGYTGNAQLRVALTSWWSTVVSLNQYWSELGGAALGGAQGSGTFETTTLRVGFSWTVPLYTPRS